MNSFKITGGKKLRGSIIPQGSKNGALQLISAVLLTEEAVTISNVPNVLDVRRFIDLLEYIGVEVKKSDKGVFTFKSNNIDIEKLKTEKFKKDAGSLRGSILIAGPLLARFGRAYIAKPGGDKIGRRHMDSHFLGFKKLGADFDYDKPERLYSINAKNLKGTYILLDEASLTGTANIIMAAVMAEGDTRIYNAACEPYIEQLCDMLNSMGAKIKGAGSNSITIEGVKKLNGTSIRVQSDMIEIGSFIGLAALTKSEITIQGAADEKLGVIPDTFRRLGINIEKKGSDLFIPEQTEYNIDTYINGSILTIADAPWPGFTPDLMSIILVTAIGAKGSVLIHQKMFESRLFFVDKLIDMGAQIILCDPHRAVVIGLGDANRLLGISMTSPDIRAGVSLLIAALAAKGTSIIHNIEQIDRGYENIDKRLSSLGAQIERIEA